MAEPTVAAPASLGDFFAKKQKKKIKASNLNVVSDKKPDATKKPKTKDAEEEGWQEEQVVAATMKVEVAGKLTREEDKKEEEDTAGHAWGSVKAKPEAQGLSDRKFPTLAKSVRTSTNINIDDGSEPKVNIATSKNVFAALENEEDDDEQEVKRPKEIKPAMVQKKKGEREKVAIQREVDKYCKDPKDGKKGDDDDDDDDEEADEETQVQEPAPEEAKKKKAVKKVEEEKKDIRQKEEKEEPEDLKIKADLAAAKAKYEGRKKPFPSKTLPRSEMEEEKENKPAAGGKKKKVLVEEDWDKPKLQFMD